MALGQKASHTTRFPRSEASLPVNDISALSPLNLFLQLPAKMKHAFSDFEGVAFCTYK